MTDYIFSQLEDIGNDTFSEFNPYALGTASSSSAGFDDDMTMYDQYSSGTYDNYASQYGGYDDFSRPAEPSSPAIDEINLRSINLQDHNGQEVDHRRLNKVKLKLVPQFFGLEFEDSLKGRSVSQFFPTDIVSVVRQCDRIAIYMQFRKFLTARLWSEELYQTNTFPNANKYYKDTPFGNALYLMLELHDDAEMQAVFQYVGTDQNLSRSLRMVYAGWMYCASMCTANDVHMMSCAIQQNNFNDQRWTNQGYTMQAATMALVMEDSESFDREIVESPLAPPKRISFKDIEHIESKSTDSSPVRVPTTCAMEIHSRTKSSPYGWAKKSKEKQQVQQSKQFRSHSLPAPNTMPSLVIDPTKAKYVLPPHFYAIDDEIRRYAEDLLNRGLLLHFQFTVGFCEALQILHTPQSKERAKALLRKLTKHPVQLRDVHAVARYLLGQQVKRNSQGGAPQRKNMKRKKSNGEVESPTTITKRNSVQLSNGVVDYNAMTSHFEDLTISNKNRGQSQDECIIS